MRIIEETKDLLRQLQEAEHRILLERRDPDTDTDYIVALAKLADRVPKLIELAEEPKFNTVDTTHFCGYAPYVCRLPPGHDALPKELGGRDPYATHSDWHMKWWREPGQGGWTFGVGS